MILTHWLRLFHWPLVAAGHFSIRPLLRIDKVMLFTTTGIAPEYRRTRHRVGDVTCTCGGTRGRGIRITSLSEGRVRFDDTSTFTG